MGGTGEEGVGTVGDVAAEIRNGRRTAVEIVREVLERIERLDPSVGAFVAVDAEGALRQAAALDAERRGGRLRGPLHGVPLAYKDLCYIGGLPNTCGTALRDYYTAPEDCTVARRLVAAGAVTIGKVTMTELAMGTFGVNAVQGTPRNPRAPDRIPGGSSSGSAVAVARGLVPATIGTDTGGSIRIPAACCGVAGLKPTWGRVSRAGVMPLSPTLDHVGPLARRTSDLALLLSAIAGHDPDDPSSSAEPVPDYHALASMPVAGLSVGVPENDYFAGVDAEVAAAIEETLRVLAAAGVSVKRLVLPDPRPMMDATTVIVRAEAAAAHARALAEQPRVFQPFVRERLEIGAAIPAGRYREAVAACAALRATFVREVFAAVDAVVAPIVPVPPLTLVEATAGSVKDVMDRMTRFSRFARLFNGLGVPVLALPCGRSAAGLPLAVQIAAAPFREQIVLRLGVTYERMMGGAGAAG